MTEAQIQIAVTRHLETRGIPGIRWFAVPNGGRRSPITGRQLKNQGVARGVPDMVILHYGTAYFLEIKTEKGKPSPEQLEWLNWLRNEGFEAEIGWGLDECLGILDDWSLLRSATI